MNPLLLFKCQPHPPSEQKSRHQTLTYSNNQVGIFYETQNVRGSLETKNQSENQEKSSEIYRKEKGKKVIEPGRDGSPMTFIICNC